MTRVLKWSGGLTVLLAASLTVMGARQRPDTRLPPSAAGTHVDIAGIPIRYVQSGHGPDVLLLHGSPGSVEDWSPLFDRLVDHFRVTAFDRPGHGFSGGADIPHTPEENARITLGLVHTLGLQRVILVGHSYGAIMGLALATHNPLPRLRRERRTQPRGREAARSRDPGGQAREPARDRPLRPVRAAR